MGIKKKQNTFSDAKKLQYHGNSENPDIKIFVSHRIDLDSATIDNPLYIPVRCGAVYDERCNIPILGDNTGDHISEKRESFCEYTVQYWAWKNCKADYYGLCHYRRYLSFSDVMYPEWNEQRFAAEPDISRKTAQKYGLLNSRAMIQEIKKYDVISSITYETSNVNVTPVAYTVRDLFLRHPGLLTSNADINTMVEIVKEKFPQYYKPLKDELNSPYHRGFNCFIMKRELFNQMCEFEFGVLFELEDRFKLKIWSDTSKREIGYLGEILYGAFIRWLQTENIYRFKEKQIVLFIDTHRKKRSIQFYQKAKRMLAKILPAYRCSLRLEQKFIQQQMLVQSLCSRIDTLSTEVRRLNQREISTFWIQPKHYESDVASCKREFWSHYPKAEGDLRTVQKANTVLLKTLKRICDKIGVSFWMHGGSLIGALRHEGFVPWDDDIDIAMMRADYLKVQDYLASSEMYAITEYYYIGIGTKSYRFRRTDIDSNCFVDIFLYDNYNVSNGDALVDWRQLTHYKAYLKKQAIDMCHDMNMHPHEPMLREFPELKEQLDTLFEKYIRRTQGEQSSKWVVWGIENNYEDQRAFAWNHGRIFAKDDIFPLKEFIFEGELFFVPSSYEKYAFAEYGIDYLEIPKNMGESVHWNQFFASSEQMDLAKQILQDGIKGELP